MNTLLEPPPVPPLSPRTRARLRHRVMTDAGPSRRWAPAVIAVAAVGAVVAGSLVVRDGTRAQDPQPPVASGTPTAASPRAGKPLLLDRGPATAAQVAAAIAKCQPQHPERAQAVWSRRVLSYSRGTPFETTALLVKNTPGQPGGYYNLGYVACVPPAGAASILDSTWRQSPTRADGLVTLGGMGKVGSAGAGTGQHAHYPSYHRVRPEIARIQARYVWPGGTGRWFEGVVAGGIAYTEVTADIPPPDVTVESLRQEFRAYDARGRVIPVRG
jgi:hypothetical protein